MIRKDKKISKGQMNRQGESPKALSLFAEEIPVWYRVDGKVNPAWLSACEEERNQTRDLM
jgi:hypothetical protein